MKIEIFKYEGIYYEVTSPNTVCVSGVTRELSIEEKLTFSTSGWYPNKYIYKGDVVIPAKVFHNDKEYDVNEIGDDAFDSCENLKNVEMPDSITKIGKSAFWGCEELRHLVIPSSVREIGMNAFCGCKKLIGLRIPDAVTKIDAMSFGDCPDLTSFSIPSNVTLIDYFAFWDCLGLKIVTIGKSVQKIACDAFSGCSGLERINIAAIYPPELDVDEDNIGYKEKSESFYCYDDAVLTVPLGTKERYQEAEGWKKFKRIEEKDFSKEE